MAAPKHRIVKWPWGGFAIQKFITPIYGERPDWFFADVSYGVLDSETVATHPTEAAAQAWIDAKLKETV
jgi:hypothetical protein